MAKTNAVNFFDMDNYSQGGGFFPDGPCRWDSFRFGTYDFGKPGNDAICLIGVGQPLNADGTDNGDAKTQYWPVGDGIELLAPVKGEKGAYSQIGIAEGSQHDKLFGFSDFAIFMQHLKKAQYDMDGAENDITTLDGLLCETGKFIKKPNPKAAKVKDEGKGGEQKEAKERSIIVVAELLDEKTFGKGAKGAAKPKAKADVEEDEKPKAKAKSKAKAEVGDDPEDIILAYIEEALTDDKHGDPVLSFKIGVSAYAKKIGKDADVARAAQGEMKENIDSYLKAAGWSVDKKGNLAKDE